MSHVLCRLKGVFDVPLCLKGTGIPTSRERGMPARWTTIKVPQELRDKVKSIAEKLGKPQWQVILEAISFYDEFLRKPKVRQSVSNLEKAAWYITKLATSFGAFKENPSKENFEYLRERVQELKDRLGVDAEMLLRLAEYYMDVKDGEKRKKLRIDMNAVFKQIVKDIILSQLFDLISKEE